MSKLYFGILRPMGILRRLLIRALSFGQVPVAPTKTWGYQRNHYLKVLNITLAIDVGGNLGQWAIEARKSTSAEIFSLEPDSRCLNQLQSKSNDDPHWKVLGIAAGAENTSQNLNLLAMEHGYSSLKKLTAYGEIFSGENSIEVESNNVPVKRLDSIFTPETVQRENVWLKIDVQGYELEVLSGASEILQYIQAVEIEIPMLDLYAESPKPSQIFKILEEYDFILCAISSERWSRNGIADCDALFIKREIINHRIANLSGIEKS